MMGKNVYLPGLALLSGILGLGLRLWQRRVSFDPETLLFLSGCPAPALLLALTAAVAAVLNGFADRDADITVRLRGGDLTVRWAEDTVYMTGAAALAFTGEAEL